MAVELDENDKRLLNELQGGLPLTSRPFLAAGDKLGLSESEVLRRLRRLLDERALSRVGPVLNTRKLGGARTLAAMEIPPERLEEVAAQVSSFDAVSHNYEREHRFNLWFVVSSEDPAEVRRELTEIATKTELPLMELPALAEYFVGVRFHFDV
ncbi:MAG: AsnC family transcriptional regulator [Dehalococcoidia bacterium]|jgi:DNA-binding Lrp family transcriptional regulator